MSLLYKNEYCQLIYDHSSDFIEVVWKDFPKSAQFRDACKNLLVFMKELGIKKLLTNNTEVKLFAVSDQRWLNEVWLPDAEKLGFFCSATVIKNDVVVKTAISNIINRRSNDFITRQFDNYDEAKNWLLKVNPR